jgi:predicted esterase
MFRRLGLPLVLLVLLAAVGSPLVPAQEKKAEKQANIKAYLKAAEAEHPAILEAIARDDDLKKADLKTWVDFTLAEISRKPRSDAAATKTLHHSLYPIKYKLLGQPKAGDPLVIFLHGGANNKKMNDSAWEGATGKGLGFPCVAVPRVFDDTQAVGWWEDSALISITAMLDEIKRTHKIDTNRVYLGGYSMGAFGTPMVGTLLADRFAGIFALAGGCTSLEPYPNLRNTPFAIHIGDADKANGRLATTRKMRDLLTGLQEADKDGYKINYKEYPGVGHGLPSAAEVEVGKWLKQFKRDPYPRTLTWKPMKDSLPMFHWLKIAPTDLPPTSRRVNIQNNQLIDAPIIRARIKGNEITIDAPGIKGITLFLNDSLVDLSKPVTVMLDGKEVFNAKVGYRLTALVESLAAKEDANMYFTARVDVRR